jgi:hypothetical protein
VDTKSLDLPKVIRYLAQSAGKLDFCLAASIQDSLRFLESLPEKLLTQLLFRSWVNRERNLDPLMGKLDRVEHVARQAVGCGRDRCPATTREKHHYHGHDRCPAESRTERQTCPETFEQALLSWQGMTPGPKGS